MDEVLELNDTGIATGDESASATPALSGEPAAAQMLPPGKAVSSPATKVEPPATNGMRAILELMAEPEPDLVKISRLIAIEMGHVYELMNGFGDKGGRGQTDLANSVKTLAQLQKAMYDADEKSKKDTLNLDSPKFKFVFEAIMALFEQALHNAGIEDVPKTQVLLQFRDLVKMDNERISREMNKL